MVTVYSTKSCVFCIKLKNWLKQKNIIFDEIIVGQDISAEKFQIITGFNGVPVTEINGIFFIGYAINAIAHELKIEI